MINKYNNIVSFLIHHPNCLSQLLSSYYPLTSAQIQNYRSFLDNNLLLNNTSIEWNSDILKQFKNKQDWEILSLNPSVFRDLNLIDEFYDFIHWDNHGDGAYSTIANNYGIPWSSEIINKYEKSWDYYQLSYNPYIPWTEDLIDRHLDEWDWQTLSGNEMLPWSLSFLEKYSSKIVTDSFNFMANPALTGNFEIVQKYGHLLSWSAICSNPNLPWVEKNLLELWSTKIDWEEIYRNNIFSCRVGFYGKNLDKHLSANSDFDSLSCNTIFPWSIPLIDAYKELWNWNALSLNPKLPWDANFIDYYSDVLHWGRVFIENVIYDENGEEVDYETFMTYRDYSDQGIESNEGIPWSLDLILRFENKLDLEMLFQNKSVWDKAFKPYVDEKLIDTVLRII